MRYFVVLVAAIALASGVAIADIAGSKHDLRGDTDSNDVQTDELCVVCHTPHNSVVAVPLWNHSRSAVGQGGYSYYTSTTLTPGLNQDASSGITGLCMSCHDGTVGLGQLVNNPESTTGTPGDVGTTMVGAGVLGTDLTNDHPIGFDYSLSTAADSDFNAAPTVAEVQLFGVDGNVECASCHDPHDTTYPPFLVTSNTASAICTACHTK